jgi:hypothetical protein
VLKPFSDRRDFVRALGRGRYDAIAWTSLDDLDTGYPARQVRWLKRAGYKRVAKGDNPLLNARVALYRPPQPRIEASF